MVNWSPAMYLRSFKIWSNALRFSSRIFLWSSTSAWLGWLPKLLVSVLPKRIAPKRPRSIRGAVERAGVVHDNAHRSNHQLFDNGPGMFVKVGSLGRAGGLKVGVCLETVLLGDE